MKTINQDDYQFVTEGIAVIDAIKATNYKILDSVIQKIECDILDYNNSSITICFSSKTNYMKLVFSDIKKFCFFYENDVSQVICERYKFFKFDNGFYLSLDPFEEAGHEYDQNNDDNYFISARNVQLYINKAT